VQEIPDVVFNLVLYMNAGTAGFVDSLAAGSAFRRADHAPLRVARGLHFNIGYRPLLRSSHQCTAGSILWTPPTLVDE